MTPHPPSSRAVARPKSAATGRPVNLDRIRTNAPKEGERQIKGYVCWFKVMFLASGSRPRSVMDTQRNGPPSARSRTPNSARECRQKKNQRRSDLHIHRRSLQLWRVHQ